MQFLILLIEWLWGNKSRRETLAKTSTAKITNFRSATLMQEFDKAERRRIKERIRLHNERIRKKRVRRVA